MKEQTSTHRIGANVSLKDMTLFPVEKIERSTGDLFGATSFSGYMEPVAIVVVAPGGIKAIDMRSNEITLGEIEEFAPELSDALRHRIDEIANTRFHSR